MEGIQNYKLSEFMGKKLQHDRKKVIHNFSSYQLSATEKLLLWKGLNFSLPPKRLEFENYYHLNCYTEMFMIVIIKMNLFCTLKSKRMDVVLSS